MEYKSVTKKYDDLLMEYRKVREDLDRMQRVLKQTNENLAIIE